MDIEKIKALIAQKESHTIEFKKTTGQIRPAFETVCAFLNGDGGTVLFGVNDNGQIIGQEVGDNTRQDIASELRKIEPAATEQIDIHYVPVEKNKFVIVIEVAAGNHIPYVYDGRAFHRNQSTTSRTSQHHYEQLLVQRGQINHSWEERIAFGYNIDDLDHDEIYRTIQEGIRVNRIPADAAKDNIEAALERFELLDGGKLKNAAVVLFAKKLFPDYAQCMLKMARFTGITHTGNFIDNQEVYGNIFKLLTEADFFVRRHLPIASLFSPDQFERIDKPALPALAVREAMVNAVCHRDYNEKSSAITLAIFDDRLEIWNYGTLSSKLHLDDLKKKHRSFPRNKLIANVLYSRQYFEKWGTGTNKMIDLCREQDIPSPQFEEYSGGFEITFKFKEPIGFTGSHATKKPELNIRQEEILKILSNGKSWSANEIFAQLQNPPSLRTVKADLLVLQKRGLVEKQGSSRFFTWKIRE